ncbi:MAG: glycosyltransferase [bacterium]
MKILYFCSEAEGGLASYAQFQSQVLAQIADVAWLAPDGLNPLVPMDRPASIPLQLMRGVGLCTRAARFARSVFEPLLFLDKTIGRVRPDCVLLSSWSEYFAPLWAWRFRRWRKRGVRFAAVIHDPVRDFVRGPLWWHRWSIREAYSFLDVAFVHEAIELDTAGLARRIPTVVIPHGPYLVPVGTASPTELRRKFDIPESAYLLLSFGHIRDGKNLNLLIEAMAAYPDVWLLVAGREQSASQRTVAWYQKLAEDLGVADRCRWANGFVPECDVWEFFTVADAVALTYSRDFRSASGVLNVNAQFRKTVLASSGPGPLKTAVEQYQLGEWVAPDSAESLKQGLARMLANRPDARWGEYLVDHSWEENAKRVLGALCAI